MSEDTTDKSRICPCCGQTLTSPSPKTPDGKMALWMAAMMSGTPYTDTYPLYGGAVTVTAAMPDRQASLKLSRALTSLRSLRDVAIDRQDDPVCRNFTDRYDDLEAALRTLAFVREVTFTDNGDHREYDVASVVGPIVGMLAELRQPGKDNLAETVSLVTEALEDLERPELVSGLPAQAMVTVVAVHQQMHSMLSEAGMDENFWRGIRLG